MTIFFKKFSILILLLVVIIVGAIYAANSSPSAGDSPKIQSTRLYSNEALGLNFEYPGRFTVLQQFPAGASSTAPIAIVLSADDGQIVVAPSLVSMAEGQKDVLRNETTLFQDASGRMRNSKITLGQFTGFKSLVDFNNSRYILYLPAGTDHTLELKIDTSAKTPDSLLSIEEILRSILMTAKI